MTEIKIFTELQKGEQIEIGLNLVSKPWRQKYFTFFVALVQLYSDFLTKIRLHMLLRHEEDYACMNVLSKVDLWDLF